MAKTFYYFNLFNNQEFVVILRFFLFLINDFFFHYFSPVVAPVWNLSPKPLICMFNLYIILRSKFLTTKFPDVIMQFFFFFCAVCGSFLFVFWKHRTSPTRVEGSMLRKLSVLQWYRMNKLSISFQIHYIIAEHVNFLWIQEHYY